MVQFGVQSSSAAPAASAAAAAASSSLNIRTCSSQLHSKQSHSTAFHLPSLPLNPFRNTFMGVLLSRFWAKLSGAKEVRVLILGLDNAGKTTILYRLHSGEVVTTIPTIGFNVETLTHKNLQFQVWDLGGQDSIRPYWRCYIPNTNAIIYVIDSTDVDRLQLAKDELLSMLSEEELKGAALCVFANKKDLPGAKTAAEITELLGLTSMKDRQWTIQSTSAVKGEGLGEGMDWLANVLASQQ